MKNFLAKLPYDILILAAIMLAIVPIGEPHLLQKLNMLFNGTLKKPLDIFDLFMHSTPIVLLILKFTLTSTKS